MSYPIFLEPRRVAPETHFLPQYLEIPGLGVLPVNTFVIQAQEPVLVDTGLPIFAGQFEERLSSVVDPRDLRWIYLTHIDNDHIGALDRVLEIAPQAKLVTTFLGLGKLSLIKEIAPERLYLLNPGQELDVGDRKLRAVKPPIYDAPETTGLFDTRTGALVSSDCFGAVLESAPGDAAAISDEALSVGMSTWATVDSPWLAMADSAAFEAKIAEIERLKPSLVLSSHLPPAADATRLFANLRSARDADPFVGPDQALFTAMLAAA